MSTATASYIRSHLPDGTLVAITVFESSAFEEAGLTNITDDTVREDLISVLPTFASGGTDIGAGMELCREVSPKLCEQNFVYLQGQIALSVVSFGKFKMIRTRLKLVCLI